MGLGGVAIAVPPYVIHPKTAVLGRAGGDKNQPAGNNKVYGKNNERPRKKLNFSTPKECFYKTLHNFALAC